MFKFLFRLLVVFAILLPIFFLVAPNINTTNAVLEDECNDNLDNDGDTLIDGNDPGCQNDPDPVGARDEDLDTGTCDLRVHAQGGFITNQPVTVSVDVTQSGTYRVYVNNQNPQDKNTSVVGPSSLIFTLSGSLFPVEGSYSISAKRVGTPNDPSDPSVACTNSPQTITVQSTACSNKKDDDGDSFVDFPFDKGCRSAFDNDERGDPQFINPHNGAKFNFGMVALPSVVVIDLEPGEEYNLVLGGLWSGSEIKDFGRGDTPDWFQANNAGQIWLSNICENGEDTQKECTEEFKPGNYTIKVQKIGSNEDLATTSFDVVTDGSGVGTFVPIHGENPCKDFDGDGDIECKTAIGDFTPEIGEFAEKILAIGIGLAGGIALIIMVIGSIRVLTSAGDPKSVGAGREMIIAAVAGLLFLIFSMLILRFIGVEIISL